MRGRNQKNVETYQRKNNTYRSRILFSVIILGILVVTPLHFTKFNDRVKAMNAGASKELKLSAAEARALHTDIFAMLEEMNDLRANKEKNTVIEVTLDAGDNSL